MGVMIRNPKMDSKSKFGGPKTVEERVGCARGQVRPKWPPCVPRESHVWPTWSTHGSQGKGHFGLLFPSLLFLSKLPIPSHTVQEAKFEIKIFLTIFGILF